MNDWEEEELWWQLDEDFYREANDDHLLDWPDYDEHLVNDVFDELEEYLNGLDIQ